MCAKLIINRANILQKDIPHSIDLKRSSDTIRDIQTGRVHLPQLKMIINQFSGKIYPDKSFTIGAILKKAPTERDRKFAKFHEEPYDQVYEAIEDKSYPEGIKVVFQKINEVDVRLAKSRESSQPKKIYGQKGISANGKRTVKNSALLMEQEYGIKRLGFVTCTLPGYSKAEISYIASNWYQIQRRFFQKVRRLQERLKQPVDMISCTEIQERRYKKYGVVAPHLHFIYVCRTRAHSRKFTILAETFRRFWRESVTQVLHKEFPQASTNISYKASIDCQVITKSVYRYLSKYLSKGGRIISDIHENNDQNKLPRQWWTASKEMKAKFKKSIIRLEQSVCAGIFDDVQTWYEQGLITWFKYIIVDIHGRDITIGCVGIFSDEYYQLLAKI